MKTSTSITQPMTMTPAVSGSTVSSSTVSGSTVSSNTGSGSSVFSQASVKRPRLAQGSTAGVVGDTSEEGPIV